jgi:hypothetical protein
MGLFATLLDKHAYAQIGGAMDSVAETYAYVAKGLSTVDDARDPLKNTGRLSKFVKSSDKIRKAYQYFREIQNAFDETKRDGAIFKIGIKASIDLAGKLLGTSISTHPYYVYHKVHFEVLASVLNAHRNHQAAIEAYRTAIRAADSDAVRKEFQRLEERKVEIVANRSQFKDTVGIAADIARGLMTDDFARKKIAHYGSARLAQAVADLETWRANWAGLAFDALQLQIMAGNELAAAMKAMQKVKELISGLIHGNSAGRVAGYGAINAIEWEKYDQIVRRNKPSQLMIDPVQFAQGNLDKAAAWAEAFSQMCDFVRTEEVLYAGTTGDPFNTQLEKLNKVLYG